MSEVRFAWNANAESNIADYLLHAGLASGVYNAPGSPKSMGNVTSGGFDIQESGLWFFALTAVNTGGLASEKSSEVSRSIALGLGVGRGN